MKRKYLERISVVVSVYNCDHLIKRCIDSLIATLDGELPEFIVVDNAASNSTRELIAHYSPYGLRYQAMPRDGGFAGANNVGYALTSKEFVILVNSDTVFHENPFPPLIDFMDAHPKAQVAQGTVVLENGIPGEDGKLDTCGGGIAITGRITNPAYRMEPEDERYSFARPVFYAYGALFLFRRDAPAIVGGFLFRDEFYAYYEETDFCHRMWLSGNEVWYVPTPAVGHAHTATFKKQYGGIPKLLLFTVSNRRCSFLSCLGLWTLLPMLILSETSTFLLAVNHLCHGHPIYLKNYFSGWMRSLKMLPATLRRRKAVQKIRAVSDRQLRRRIFDRSSFRDFIREIRGTI